MMASAVRASSAPVESPPAVLEGARILCVSSGADVGGAEMVLLDTVVALRGAGATVSFLNLAPPRGPLAEGVRGRGIEPASLPIGRFRNPVTAWRVMHWLASHGRRLDLILANDTRALLYAALATPLGRHSYVWHVHDLFTGGDWFQAAALWTRPLRYIAISQAVADSLVGHGCPSDRISVVPNAVDTERFSPSVDGTSFRAELGVTDETLVIGAVSRILPWKGLDVFVEAIARLGVTFPRTLFVVVGDIVQRTAHRDESVRYRERLSRLREELGLRERLILVGGRADMPTVMAGLDMLVHTAIDEPFGRVLIEAMASGTPVVATHGGGVPEIVRDGATGYLVAPRDPEALAARIRALADPATRDRMGRAGRERAVALFGLPRYRERITAAVAQALSRSGGAGR
jgi:glycosyltransferase involved in cell wall biosynthesis